MAKPHLPATSDERSDFLAEASPNARGELEQGLELLAGGLSPVAPRVAAERLERAVSTLPLRYAPFYRRLAELWQLPEALVESELLRARNPGSWSTTPLPGLRTFAVGTTDDVRRRRLLEFAPGASFPSHRHLGDEQVLVLEGSYADSSGREVKAGEHQQMAAGSEHALRILGDVRCVAAVLEHGIDFSNPWLRWPHRLLR